MKQFKVKEVKRRRSKLFYIHTWQDIFKITQEENANYDRETEQEVEEYLNNNPGKVRTYEKSNINRLQGDDSIDTRITSREIYLTIKSFRNETPGETNIHKTVLSHLPENALTTLQNLLNHSFSMGYFPLKFKTAIIQLIPKPNTNHTDPINYRPISLLEERKNRGLRKIL